VKSLRNLALFASLTSLALSASSVAQEHPNQRRGTDIVASFALDQVDAVNLFNGNLTLSLPIGGSYPVGGSGTTGGLAYALGLHYNAHAWEFEEGPYDLEGQPTTTAFPDPHQNAGMGWSVTLGRLHAPMSGRFNTSTQWLLVESDGTRRAFAATLHDGETPVTNVFYTRDGSYLRMKKTASPPYKWEVESPSGLVRIFDFATTRLEQVRDRSGNTLTVTYGTNLWTLTDNSNNAGGGRTHEIEFYPASGDVPERVKEIRLARFGGSTATYSFAYSVTNIPRHSEHSSEGLPGGEPATIDVALLSSVTLPDDRTFAMQYFLTPYLDLGQAIQDEPGLLKELQLPTNGKYEWDYRKYVVTGGAPLGEGWVAKSDGVRFKRVYGASGALEGTWEYDPSVPRPAGSPAPGDLTREVRRSVKSPEGDLTIYYFTSDNWIWTDGLPFSTQWSDGGSPALYLSQQVFDGSSPTLSTVKRAEWVRFTADAGNGGNQRLERRRTEYNDNDNKYATLVLSGFDGLGHYRTATTGGNFGAGDVRVTTTDFNPARGTYDYDAESLSYGPNHTFSMLPDSSPWLTELYTYQRSTESGVSSQTSFSFNASTGFLDSYRVLRTGTATGNNDVFVAQCGDSRGNVAAENFFGGDDQNLSALTLDCLASSTWAYRTTHAYAYGSRSLSQQWQNSTTTVGFNAYQADIDPSTGLVAADYDPSGYKTTYTFDALGRLALVAPLGSSNAEKGAETRYAYSGPSGSIGGSVQIDVACPTGITCSSPSPPSFGRTTLEVDGFGRLLRERVLQADGTYSRKKLTYNAMGWKTAESEVGPDVDTNPATEFRDFDPFGRPLTIRPPDGSAHDVTLTYHGISQVSRAVKIATNTNGSETSSTATEYYDRQGRLWKVLEPAAPSGANLDTFYGYDVDNRLVSVTQKVGGNTLQSRSFAYDHRGFLLSETHPEKGAAGNGTVSYLSYDAKGHASERRDGSTARSLTFAFDKAELLTTVSETGGNMLKRFTYGTSGAAKGKLDTAERWNYFPALSMTALVTEDYGYGGTGLRVTSRSTQLHYSGANRERFDQTFTWNRDGSLQSQTYPRCFNGGCGAGGVSGRTVTNSYANGFQTGVNGYATIGYHKNGQVASIAHTNGVTDTILNDPALMRRPQTIQVTGPGWSQSTGTYTYDGAGNIEGIGADRFAYDGASRLVTAAMGTGGQSNTQNYAFDALGNITSITTNGVVRNTPTSTSTNRLTGAGVSYDAGGNLLTWNGQTYEYDRLNMPTRRTVGGEDWIFAYTADDERIWSYRTTLGGSVVTPRGLDNTVLRRHEAHLGWGTFTDNILGNDRILATESSAGVRTHFHSDHLGTPKLLTTAAGATATFYTYYPFGEELFPVTDTQPHRFTGHERDLLSTAGTSDDIDYMHARSHLPLLGRFSSTDPAGAAARSPQSWNRYAYVMDRPVTYNDPSGLWLGLHGWFSFRNSLTFSDSLTVIGGLPDPFSRVDAEYRGWWSFLAPPYDPSKARREIETVQLSLVDSILSEIPDISPDQAEFWDCVEANRLDWGKVSAFTIGNPLANLAAGYTGRSGFGGLKSHATSWEHKVGGWLARQTGSVTFSRIGKLAGRAALVPTVFEGFYDIGTMGRCAALGGD
jgi:RHS repeat-associated protein